MAMASTNDGPPSQGREHPVQSSPTGAETSSSQPTGDRGPDTAAPAPAPGRTPAICELTRSGSDRISLGPHSSLPDNPGPQPPEVPRAGASDMPPLEDDVAGLPPPGPLQEGGEGDVFLILDLPEHSTVGCDAGAIGTGTSGFKGIRGIPPGAHLVWVSEPGAYMSRSGFWFVTSTTTTTTTTAAGAGGRRVRVGQWDGFNEVLVQPASRPEARDLSEDMAGLYPQLLPHDYFHHHHNHHGGGTAAAAAAPGTRPEIGAEDAARTWRRLTSSIDERLLGRVTGRRAASEWLVDTSDSARGESGFPRATQARGGAAAAGTGGGGGELDFLFPEGDVDLGAVGDGDGDGTPDTTASILRLVDTPGTGVTGPDLLGELQLTFLTGLHLSSPSCAGQWWHLVLRVVLRAHGLALLRPGLARALIRTLHAQLAYSGRYVAGGDGDGDDEPTTTRGGAEGILDAVPGNRRRLRSALTLFKRRMDGILLDGRVTAEQAAVGRAFVDMEVWLWRRFGWDLRVDAVGRGRGREGGEGGGDDDDDDDDDDDYQPVIVDLDENGREVGLVSFN